MAFSESPGPKMIQRFWAQVARYAAEPTDSAEWRLKKMIGVAAMLGAVLALAVNGLVLTMYGETLAGQVAFGAGALYLGALVSYGFFRHYGAHIVALFGVQVAGTVVLQVLLGGFAQSGAVAIWMMAFPMVAIVAYRYQYGMAFFGLIVLLIVGLAWAEPWYWRDTNLLPTYVRTGLFVYSSVGSATFGALAVSYFIWRNEVLTRLVAQEQHKAEVLLLNILPAEIAAILKDDQRVIANHHAEASILFADVVNFTPLATQLPPTELVELLNEVFSHFDGLVEKYGLEKIKTIGDCYMVAGGVPRPRADHAQAITKLALEMQAFVTGRVFRGRSLAFRIGINSGPVVAGVIGRKKFIYDLWGDAVNTASRMESHGQGGVIQITRATYDLIQDGFVCEPHGSVNVKGKGEMDVWQVLGARAI